MKSDPRLIDVSLFAIGSGALVIGKAQMAGKRGSSSALMRARHSWALPIAEPGLLKLLTPRKKSAKQCRQFKR
jgi:hypothetical protein